jgi:glyoxylase-like metal-dependent hydrolase (beta-lactamase superfamily II)
MHKPILLSLALLCCCAAAQAQESAAPSLPFTLKPLGNNVYAAIANPKSNAGSNSGFVIGDNGVVVVDTFVTADAAKALLVEIQKLTKLPIKFVVNTHYHLDHVAGNGVYAQAGAVVIGHKNLRGWIHTENLKFFGPTPKPEQKSMVEALHAPDLTYDSAIELFVGTKPVLVRYYPGHTGGDSVVFSPDAQVVFTGDLFWCKTLPNLIDGTTEKWAETDAKLAAEFPNAKFVSGHGDVGTAEDVKAFEGYINDLRAAVAAGIKNGQSGDALVVSVTAQIQPKYSKWDAYDYFLKRNIADTEKELRGTKKIPQPSAQ